LKLRHFSFFPILGELNIYQLIDPIDTMIFGGKIDQLMPAPARFIFGLSKEAPLDYRDNKKIEDWAKGLINDLK